MKFVGRLTPLFLFFRPEANYEGGTKKVTDRPFFISFDFFHYFVPTASRAEKPLQTISSLPSFSFCETITLSVPISPVIDVKDMLFVEITSFCAPVMSLSRQSKTILRSLANHFWSTLYHKNHMLLIEVTCAAETHESDAWSNTQIAPRKREVDGYHGRLQGEPQHSWNESKRFE